MTAIRKCCRPRKPIKGKGYVGWHNEADRRGKTGWTCEQCGTCGLWSQWFTPAESRQRARSAG